MLLPSVYGGYRPGSPGRHDVVERSRSICVRRLRRNRWLGLVLVPPGRISIATLHRRTGFLKIAMPTQQLQVARVINAPQVEWSNMIVVCMPIGAEEVCKIS